MIGVIYMKKYLYPIMASTILICLAVNPVNTKALETDTPVTEEPIDETSGLIFSYDLSINSGSKKIYITGTTGSRESMKSIGFKNFKIQRSSNGTSWTTEKTLSDMLDSDSYGYYLNDYSVSVQGGYYYRVTCTHYAKESGLFGGSQSVNNTSNSVWIS